MGYASLFNKSEHFKESPGTIRVKNVKIPKVSKLARFARSHAHTFSQC